MTRPFHLRMLGATAMLLAPLLLGAPASAQPAAPVASTDYETESETAQVVAVDAAKRLVTLKASSGETLDIVAGENVRNFAQIKVGDVVVATVERALTFVVTPRGTKLPPAAQLDQAARAKPGAKPGAAVARSTAVTATIVSVDVAAKTVDVVDQRGGALHKLTVRNPERQAYLPKIKPGDLLTVIYTTAVALSVEPGGKL
jgi:hypothetical protein